MSMFVRLLVAVVVVTDGCENEAWKGINREKEWQCEDHWRYVLHEVVQSSVSSVVTSNVAFGVKKDGAGLGWVSCGKPVDELVRPHVAWLQNFRLVERWEEIQKVDRHAENERAQERPAHSTVTIFKQSQLRLVLIL